MVIFSSDKLIFDFWKLTFLVKNVFVVFGCVVDVVWFETAIEDRYLSDTDIIYECTSDV